MSGFEFVLTGVSIVLALAVARLLEGLRDTLDSSRRYWIHSLWVLTKLMNTIVFFWNALPFRESGEADFASFLIMISVAGVFFLQAHALVTAHPDQVADWKVVFWSIRRWFFAANILAILLLLALLLVGDGGVALIPRAQVATLALLLLFSSAGFASSSERLHGWIVLAVFTANAGIIGSFLSQSLRNAA